MLSAARRRLAVLVSVSVLGLVAAGCAEVRHQTQWSGNRQHGVNAEAGEIEIRDVVVVSDSEGQQATVLATLVNDGNEADELVQVRVGSGEAEPEDASVSIPANGSARLGPDGTQLDVEGLEAAPGSYVEIELIFGRAPRTTVSALVHSADGIYADALSR